MNFKIGDKVKFKLSIGLMSIPQYYTENDGIPDVLLRHGNVFVDKVYYKKFNAEIIDIYQEYYIVEYKDGYGNFTKLGFKEESLESAKRLTVKQLNKKYSDMIKKSK